MIASLRARHFVTRPGAPRLARGGGPHEACVSRRKEHRVQPNVTRTRFGGLSPVSEGSRDAVGNRHKFRPGPVCGIFAHDLRQYRITTMVRHEVDMEMRSAVAEHVDVHEVRSCYLAERTS
jgi:hypothetical protein